MRSATPSTTTTLGSSANEGASPRSAERLACNSTRSSGGGRQPRGAPTNTTCAVCAAPTDATICHGCTNGLAVDLGQAPTLLRELDTTRYRLARLGGHGGAGDTPLPWHEPASLAARQLTAELWGWARVVHEELDHEVPIDPATYLERRVDGIRIMPWAGDLHARVTELIRAGWRAIDRPEQRYYAGPCSETCDTRLWFAAGQIAITCPTCRSRWLAQERRDWLLAAARDVEAPAVEIASALSLMTGRRLTASTIRVWVHRGLLVAVGERDGAKLYRLGDVLDVLTRHDLPPVVPEQRQPIDQIAGNGGRA